MVLITLYFANTFNTGADSERLKVSGYSWPTDGAIVFGILFYGVMVGILLQLTVFVSRGKANLYDYIIDINH